MHRNTVNNIASLNHQLDKKKCLEDLKELVAQHYHIKFNIYIYISNNAVDNMLEMHESFCLVIFDSERNHELEENLARTFHISNIMWWRETEKIGHSYKQSKLYTKLKIWK